VGETVVGQLSWDSEFVFEAVLITVCFAEYSDVEKLGRQFLSVLQESNVHSCAKHICTVSPTAYF
jgi:hypothetical protein